jgi:hypothetical protein
MSQAAQTPKSDKQALARQALREANGHKPRSPEKDFWVFVGGVGSLIYVVVTMAPH